MATPKYKSIYDGASKWNESQTYDPYASYANAMVASADSAYNNAVANADLVKEQSIAAAQKAYKDSRATYGANAEKYLARGLAGSGVSEYADSSAYAAMRGEIANANAVRSYAEQDALYKRDQAYASADAYMAQAEQSVYNNLLNSVMNGGLTKDTIDSVASAYGLNNPKAVEKLKSAADAYVGLQEKAGTKQTDDLQKVFDYIADNGITDAETADRVAQGAGYSEDSEAYASILAAAEQNAERQKTIADAGKVAWSATNVNGAKNDDFRLTIGDTEFKLSTKSGNEVKDQSVIDRLNEMATGDKAKKPSATNGNNNSTDNAGAFQILNGKMYMYKQNKGAWVEVTDRNKNNKVDDAIKAWNDASFLGKFKYFDQMTEAEKRNLLQTATYNENTQAGLDTLAAALKNAGVPEATVSQFINERKKAYSDTVDANIDNQYKDVPADSAYKEHLSDLEDDLISDAQKTKIKAAFVKNQGLNGLREIFDDKIAPMLVYDTTGKSTDGYTSNAKKLLDDNNGIKGLYASLGYNITDTQAKDIESVYADVLNPTDADEYNAQLNRKR